MGKNKVNYSAMSNNKNSEAVNVEPEVTETVTETAQDTTPEVATKPEMVEATVSNCTKLNVRKSANKKASVVCVISAGDKVQVNMSESSDKWYKVTTKNKKNGYCMVNFVTLDN